MNCNNKIMVSAILPVFLAILFMTPDSYADEWRTVWEYEEKKPIELSDWSLSFYLAFSFGGMTINPITRMRSPGIQDHYNFSTEYMLYSITRFEPKSWMVQLDYRMIKWMGLGLSAGNSVLAKGPVQIGPLNGSGNMIRIGNSVKTVSLMLTIYLNDYMILGFGPTYNMTNAPSGSNKVGFLGQLTIRIPLDERFSVNGIVQYRYVGITEIGPYELYNDDDSPAVDITSANYNFPETQIDFSHVFVGIGMSLYFTQK